MSTMHVMRYKKMAIKAGMIQVDENGKEIISDRLKNLKEFQILHKDFFAKKPIVKEWISDLLTRNQGKPIKTWKTKITALRHLCNYCRINPEQLIIDRQTTEKIMKNFAEMCRTNTCSNDKSDITNRETTIHNYVMIVRGFCGFYGISWPKGVSGIMSGKVMSHGKYADIRLTQKELDIADSFIKEKWGIDSDIYRIFWVGIESCSRKSALLEMKCQWFTHTNQSPQKEIFCMIAYESKTSQIKGGKWRKYITREDTQKSLQMQKDRQMSYIWNHIGSRQREENRIRKLLREIFKYLGKLDDYYYSNPFHSLRHVGAHYWLEKTNYNYGFVAMVGGWHTIDELKTSYGEMPPEFIINMLETKLVHNMFS